jgi:2-haloalkanoic acid dehalogenase type II
MTARLFDVVTFDCYGTLINWDAGITEAFTRLAGQLGVSPRDLRASYEAIEPVVEAEAYRSYKEVLAETARRAADGFGRGAWESEAATFAESLPEWAPFPDTNPALEQLAAAGYRLGLLSNTDDDLIAATCRHFAVPFDLIITAEQVRSYKPAHGHFLEARNRVGSARWLHAAQSHFHDIVPAHELGIENVWINRRHERTEGVTPDHEFPNLTDLANWLVPAR